MTVSLDTVQLCRAFVTLTLSEAQASGRSPVEVLKAYRCTLKGDAPLNDVLMREIDRTLLELSATLPA